MNIFTGTVSTLPAGMFFAMARFRHEVFVNQLGWPLHSHAGMELDQFDRRDTVYVLACDAKRRIIGTSRLLPTHRPYLLGDVFPQLLGDTPAPCSPFVWEISRFAAAPPNFGDLGSERMPCPTLSLDFFRASMQAARCLGARRIVSVSPLSIERILRRGAIKFTRLAPPMRFDGRKLFACCIDLQPGATLQRGTRWQAEGESVCKPRPSGADAPRGSN